MMSKKNWIINVVINSIIVTLTIVAVFLMFFGEAGVLASSRWVAFKYFTVQSNVVAAIASAISLIYFIFKKDKEYPTWVVTTKMVSTMSVAVTFFVTLIYLGPIYGYPLLYLNANLYLHAIIPVLAMINFALTEPKNKMSFKLNLYSFIPVGIYGTIYMINVASKNDWGNVKGADWYAFGSYGPGIGMVCLIVILALSFILSIGLYFLHQKTRIKFLY